MRRAISGACVVVALTGSACGGGSEATRSVAEFPADTGIDSTTITTAGTRASAGSAPPPTVDSTTHSAPDGWRISRQLPVDTVILGADGVSIEVTITGGPAREPSDPCSRNYELHRTETETDARLALFELVPSSPEQRSEGFICTSEGHPWRLGVMLDDPLGRRDLIDDLTGQAAIVFDLAVVLQPAEVGAGWTSHAPVAQQGRLDWYFSDQERDPAFLTVATSPISVLGLDSIRSQDLVRIDEIMVRGGAGIRVTSLEDGAVTVAWEEDQRLYRVHGYLVDQAELATVAEAMGAPPAEPDG